MAERKGLAGETPPLPSLQEASAQKTLARLSGDALSDSMMARIVNAIEHQLVLNPSFNKDTFKEFLRHGEVQQIFWRVHQDTLANEKPDQDSLQALGKIYSEISGESSQFARGTVLAVIESMHAGALADVEMPGTATLLQAGQKKTIDLLIATRKDTPQTRELIDKSAAEELKDILKRRALPNEKSLPRLKALLNDLDEGGKYALATNGTRTDALNWMIRLSAPGAESHLALAAAQQLSKLEATPQPITAAYIEAAAGNIDGALRRKRSIDYAPCGSCSTVMGTLCR